MRTKLSSIPFETFAFEVCGLAMIYCPRAGLSVESGFGDFEIPSTRYAVKLSRIYCSRKTITVMVTVTWFQTRPASVSCSRAFSFCMSERLYVFNNKTDYFHNTCTRTDITSQHVSFFILRDMR